MRTDSILCFPGDLVKIRFQDDSSSSCACGPCAPALTYSWGDRMSAPSYDDPRPQSSPAATTRRSHPADRKHDEIGARSSRVVSITVSATSPPLLVMPCGCVVRAADDKRAAVTAASYRHDFVTAARRSWAPRGTCHARRSSQLCLPYTTTNSSCRLRHAACCCCCSRCLPLNKKRAGFPQHDRRREDAVVLRQATKHWPAAAGLRHCGVRTHKDDDGRVP